MTTYERGASCGKGNHKYEVHDTYEKCSICGSSRSLKSRAEQGKKPRHHTTDQEWEDFWQRYDKQRPTYPLPQSADSRVSIAHAVYQNARRAASYNPSAANLRAERRAHEAYAKLL